MSKYLCADCVLREQCDGEWTTNCANYKKEPLTNEEWFDSLTLTEKSEFMAKAFESLLDDIENGKDVSFVKTVAFWDYWLKAVHKE